MHDVGLAHRFEQLAGHVIGRAGPGGRIVERAGLRLGQRDEFLAGLVAGTDGCTTISRSELLTGATATKSRMSWNGLFGISDSFAVCVFDIISSV